MTQHAKKQPQAQSIQPNSPDEFGLIQVWWGGGKGKTTAALGMGFRAAGHGYRVHMVQFMKGGAASVDDVRGEYNAIAAMPGFSYEIAGHYGWHGFNDGSADEDHELRAQAGFDRVRSLVGSNATRDLSASFPLDGPPEDGFHLLILDEILYAVNRDLIAEAAVVRFLTEKPDSLEVVLTGGHKRPSKICEAADLVTHVEKDTHPFDTGQRARKGTEY